MLTFLVFLRVVRRLEIVPSDAVVAPETVNIRHRVYPSPERIHTSVRAQGPRVLGTTRTEGPFLLCWPI